ncbi:phage N-6-adenine-methyltransferase [Desulfovibrio sp. OttesenSCG-928-G15]|nr:phage N-6-adenine-methyltransferase [Desulfovibrio sp. OttesenSCG-928-G15]
MNPVHYKSDKMDWETPPELFARCNEKWGPFDLDVCALPHNAKCDAFYDPTYDGLRSPWFGTCWCNPPYKSEPGKWLAKAHAEVQAGRAKLVVALVASRTDNKWWHGYVMRPGVTVVFLAGRVRFVGADSSAPFPSALVVITADAHPVRVETMAARGGA